MQGHNEMIKLPFWFSFCLKQINFRSKTKNVLHEEKSSRPIFVLHYSRFHHINSGTLFPLYAIYLVRQLNVSVRNRSVSHLGNINQVSVCVKIISDGLCAAINLTFMHEHNSC